MAYLTELMVGTAQRNLAKVQALLRAVDVNDRDPYTGRTALHVAMTQRQLPVIRALLAAGADPNLQDNTRRSVLEEARGYLKASDDPELLVLLLRAGADIDAVERREKTARDWLAAKAFNESGRAAVFRRAMAMAGVT